MSGERRDTTLRQLLETLDGGPESTETAGWLAAGVRQRLDQRRAAGQHTRRIVQWAAPVAALLVVATLLVRPSMLMPESPDRIKGPDATLTVYRQTTAGSEQLNDGSVARPGDIVRLGYKVSAPGFGLIVSVDDRGVVTVHHPGDARRAAELRDGDLVLLDQAYELDDAPERERFYLITAAAPFDVDAIVSIVKREAASHDVLALPLPPALTQSTFLLQKDSRP